MLRVLIHIFLSLTLVAFSYGQRIYTVQGAVRHEALLDVGNGNTLQLCTHDIDYLGDSSYCELVWTNLNQIVTNARRFRINPTYYPFIGFACDIAQLNDGFVIGGGGLSSGPENLPFLLKVGMNGNLEWSGSFSSFALDQISMKKILSSGDSFTAYSSYASTYTGGCGFPPGNQIYRIKGESTGTVWNGMLISAAKQNKIVVLDAMEIGDYHVLGGVGSGSGGERIMLMSADDSGAVWINYYDMANGQMDIEFAPNLACTADGDIVLVGSWMTDDSNYRSIAMKVDPAGAAIWSVELENTNGGLVVRSIHELPDGDLLAVGYTTTDGWDYVGVVIRLTALGDIIWQKTFDGAQDSGPLLADISVNDLGEMKLLMDWKIAELDPAGSGCGFTDISAISATPFTPSVTSIPFTNSAVPLSFVPEIFPARTPTVSWSVYCDPLGMEVLPEKLSLGAYPVPSSDFVQLGEPGVVAVNERVIIRDITGALRDDVSYGTALDLRALSCGVYFCELPRTGQRVRIVKQ